MSWRYTAVIIGAVLLSGPAWTWAQSCGAVGGDYCSQSGGCPEGYDSLGATYDCNPCCRQQPPPPPPPTGNLYVYEDYSIDSSAFSATGTAETDTGRAVRVLVTMVAPDGRVIINCSGCGAPAERAPGY